MDDLNFSMHKKQITTKKQLINLSQFIQARVEYFQSIAESSGIYLKILQLDRNCVLDITEIELTRWIDNNLSNAIKYSDIDTIVTIELKRTQDHYCLRFINKGQKIKDLDKIFQRFHREDEVQGGFGIGLNIVHSICEKYDIKIVTTSENNVNTFSYYIKCHTKVTQK
jgi:signal transduction histidine kinase